MRHTLGSDGKRQAGMWHTLGSNRKQQAGMRHTLVSDGKQQAGMQHTPTYPKIKEESTIWECKIGRIAVKSLSCQNDF